MEPINIISFSLQPLNVAREISDIFEKNQIKAYTYHFSTNTAETIKWGLSNDNEWKVRLNGGTRTWGNRVYKQALGLKGWPDRNYNGDSSAIEFAELMENYYSSLTKNDVVLTVYDMGSKEFMKLPSKEQRLVLELKESEFLKMYKERHVQLPYGNVESLKRRGHLKTYIDLFEFDNN